LGIGTFIRGRAERQPGSPGKSTGKKLSGSPGIDFRRLFESIFTLLRTEIESLAPILARKLVGRFFVDVHPTDWIDDHGTLRVKSVAAHNLSDATAFVHTALFVLFSLCLSKVQFGGFTAV
jgi:hypothetical protein